MSKLEKNIALGIQAATIYEFVDKHLSGSTMNYTRVFANQYGYYVKIYPMRYNQYLYITKGILKSVDNGSYASALNDEGGYILGNPTNNHIGYIDNAVLRGIKAGLRISGITKYKIVLGIQDGR